MSTIIFKFLKNKYFLSFTALLVWVVFFDKNDILSQMDMTKKLNTLKEEKQYYINEIANSKTDMSNLKTDVKSLEKFAREKYLMKKDNEDIYVIVTEK